MCKFLIEPEFSFLWDKCLIVQLLGCMMNPLLVLKATAGFFTRVAVSFYILTRPEQVNCSDLFPAFDVTVIFLEFSLMTEEVGHVFMCLFDTCVSSSVVSVHLFCLF
jgi:hypothetical protein